MKPGVDPDHSPVLFPDPAPHPAPDAAGSADQLPPTGQPVLLVAACTGARCSALRRLGSADPAHVMDTRATERGQSESALRAAVRARPDAVLVSVPCLGPCHQASLTAVGAGIARPGSLTWLGRPVLLSCSELPRRAKALADWITGSAPDVRTLPAALRAQTERL